jgi:hypothetical protein
VLRWWTGWSWGPDVADIGARPDPPPWHRREVPPRTLLRMLPATPVDPTQLPTAVLDVL